MNHCVEQVRKYLKNNEFITGDTAQAQAMHMQLGQQILDFATAWDAGDLTATAEALPQIIWHAIALSELLELPTHALFLDVRNFHVSGVELDVEHTLSKHFDRILP